MITIWDSWELSKSPRYIRADNEVRPPAIYAFEISGDLQNVAFTSNGRWIVAKSRLNRAHIWDAQTGEAQIVLIGQSQLRISVIMSLTGRCIAIVHGDAFQLRSLITKAVTWGFACQGLTQ